MMNTAVQSYDNVPTFAKLFHRSSIRNVEACPDDGKLAELAAEHPAAWRVLCHFMKAEDSASLVQKLLASVDVNNNEQFLRVISGKGASIVGSAVDGKHIVTMTACLQRNDFPTVALVDLEIFWSMLEILQGELVEFYTKTKAETSVNKELLAMVDLLGKRLVTTTHQAGMSALKESFDAILHSRTHVLVTDSDSDSDCDSATDSDDDSLPNMWIKPCNSIDVSDTEASSAEASNARDTEVGNDIKESNTNSVDEDKLDSAMLQRVIRRMEEDKLTVSQAVMIEWGIDTATYILLPAAVTAAIAMYAAKSTTAVAKQSAKSVKRSAKKAAKATRKAARQAVKATQESAQCLTKSIDNTLEKIASGTEASINRINGAVDKAAKKTATATRNAAKKTVKAAKKTTKAVKKRSMAVKKAFKEAYNHPGKTLTHTFIPSGIRKSMINALSDDNSSAASSQ